MTLRKTHRTLDRIQKKSIRQRIKQFSKKGQTHQSDDSNDYNSEESCGHSKDWEHKMQKLIFSKKIFNNYKTNPKAQVKKSLHKKKHKKHRKEAALSTVVEQVAARDSITKMRQVGEVRGSPDAPWQLYYDGASVMASKHAGSGAMLQDLKHLTRDEFAQYIGPQTMHVAEYVGLLGGLRLALHWNVDHLCCYGDSRIVHNQVRGLWKARQFRMAFLCFHAQELVKLFRSVKFVLITRKKNLHAARLAHEAINIHWDREALAKSECEENKKKQQKNKNKKDDDDDKTDYEYYEYKSIPTS